MKKLLFCLSFLLLLSGCSSKESELEERKLPTPTPAPSPIATSEPQPILLGMSETTLLDKDENRLHNISLAIKKINGLVLADGDSFSFNNVVGERTEKRGYRKATVLMHGDKVQDYGGGVCQVSSTLFQAAKGAGLTVTERHSHQKDVGYAHQGNDAAVDYGNKDLKLVNKLGASVRIGMTLTENVVRAEVYKLP